MKRTHAAQHMRWRHPNTQYSSESPTLCFVMLIVMISVFRRVPATHGLLWYHTMNPSYHESPPLDEDPEAINGENLKSWLLQQSIVHCHQLIRIWAFYHCWYFSMYNWKMLSHTFWPISRRRGGATLDPKVSSGPKNSSWELYTF